MKNTILLMSVNCRSAVNCVITFSVSGQPPSDYELIGCFKDTEDRAMSEASKVSRQMTNQLCIQFCLGRVNIFILPMNP